MDKAIFLDRDGTVIVDRGYLDTVDGVELLPTAAKALKGLAEKGFKFVLITNQSGVGRGRFELDVVHAQHEQLSELLRPFGVRFAAIKICPHAPEDECDCRKPEPKMLIEAAEELDLDLKRSWMIGDKRSDVMAGKAVGCRTVLLGEEPLEEADFHGIDLAEAARIVTILDR